jgi:membrane protein DedA with SNARE-associated domain
MGNKEPAEGSGASTKGSPASRGASKRIVGNWAAAVIIGAAATVVAYAAIMFVTGDSDLYLALGIGVFAAVIAFVLLCAIPWTRKGKKSK